MSQIEQALADVKVAKSIIDEWTVDLHGRVHVHKDAITKAVDAAIHTLSKDDLEQELQRVYECNTTNASLLNEERNKNAALEQELARVQAAIEKVLALREKWSNMTFEKNSYVFAMIDALDALNLREHLPPAKESAPALCLLPMQKISAQSFCLLPKGHEGEHADGLSALGG